MFNEARERLSNLAPGRRSKPCLAAPCINNHRCLRSRSSGEEKGSSLSTQRQGCMSCHLRGLPNTTSHPHSSTALLLTHPRGGEASLKPRLNVQRGDVWGTGHHRDLLFAHTAAVGSWLEVPNCEYQDTGERVSFMHCGKSTSSLKSSLGPQQ